MFFKEFWKWPTWLLFARATNLGGYNHKHGHLLTGYIYIYIFFLNGYFLSEGVVYLAVVGCIVYVNSTNSVLT